MKKKKTSGKSRYDVISSITGEQESWTGVFQCEEDRKKWYNKYGKEWEAEGKKLVLVKL